MTMDIGDADLIIGIKEIPEEEIKAGKSHLFFSHTIKGQAYNMPMLRKFIDRQATLIDYERITDSTGRRLIFFGDFAGKAGMIEGLRGYGHRLREQFGIDTPFCEIKPAYEYVSYKEALRDLKRIGKIIRHRGLPAGILPVTVFLLGYGNVSRGCQETLSALPVSRVEPDKLKNLDRRSDTVFLTVFKEEHLVEHRDGQAFDLEDYYRNGSHYRSRLDTYLPYCSIYVNAIYWAEGYPVFLSRDSYRKLPVSGPAGLQMICDITCDIGGSVEMTVRATEPDNPVFIYNPEDGTTIDGWRGDGVAVCAVDNLPCEFPRESSDAFSRSLTPLVEGIMDADGNGDNPASVLPEEIRKAVIVYKGKLQADYKYLKSFL
jgi:alpha-aminoadipic semialdehyde synthase